MQQNASNVPTIRLAAVSDPHLVPPGEFASGRFNNRLEFETALPRLEGALQRCVGAGPDAVVALGDIANSGDDAALDVAVARFAATGTRAWLVGGNHDTRGRGGGRALDEAVLRAGNPEIRVPPAPGIPWRGVGIAGVALSHEDGGYRPRAADRLGQDTPSDQLLVVLSHFPLRSLWDDVVAAGWKYAGDLLGVKEVIAPLLRRNGPTIVLHGHLHLRSSLVHDRILQIGCPPLIEAPFEITHLVIATHGPEVVEVARRSEQIWPTDGVPAWPELAPARQAWRYDGTSWMATDPADDSAQP